MAGRLLLYLLYHHPSPEWAGEMTQVRSSFCSSRRPRFSSQHHGGSPQSVTPVPIPTLASLGTRYISNMVHRHTYKTPLHRKLFSNLKKVSDSVVRPCDTHLWSCHLEAQGSGAQDQPQLPETLSQRKQREVGWARNRPQVTVCLPKMHKAHVLKLGIPEITSSGSQRPIYNSIPDTLLKTVFKNPVEAYLALEPRGNQQSISTRTDPDSKAEESSPRWLSRLRCFTRSV